MIWIELVFFIFVRDACAVFVIDDSFMNTCNAMENGDNYQTATDNYMTYDAIDVMCNEQSEDDSDTDASIQSFDVYSKEAIEDYQFLQKANTNYPRNAYHRRNFNCPTRCSLHTFSRQNKSIKRFAFFLGFATLLIFITQIYSTVNYEYSLEGLCSLDRLQQFSVQFSFFNCYNAYDFILWLSGWTTLNQSHFVFQKIQLINCWRE